MGMRYASYWNASLCAMKFTALQECHVSGTHQRRTISPGPEKFLNFEKVSANFGHLTYVTEFCHVIRGNCQEILLLLFWIKTSII